MKVIIAGATGRVGSAVVHHCIENPKISSLLVLTRRPLEEDVAGNDKVTVIMHEDFSSYPAELLEKLAGAQACLWSIGGRAPQFPDSAALRRVQVEFPRAAAQAFASALAPSSPAPAAGETANGRPPFRFVFCSGAGAQWDQDKPLIFLAETRRAKGAAEEALCDVADARDGFHVAVVRPSRVLPAGTGRVQHAAERLYGAVRAEQVACAMVRIALEGRPEGAGRIVENGELLKM